MLRSLDWYLWAFQNNFLKFSQQTPTVFQKNPSQLVFVKETQNVCLKKQLNFLILFTWISDFRRLTYWDLCFLEHKKTDFKILFKQLSLLKR
jgi:hypothetical protein